MRCSIAGLLLLACAALVLGQTINENELRNRALVKSRIDCVLDRRPCDNTGRMLKAALPEVLQRGCQKCTRTQRAGARRLISFAQQNYPGEWAQIMAKYSG